jgi:hypothetical protein
MASMMVHNLLNFLVSFSRPNGAAHAATSGGSGTGIRTVRRGPPATVGHAIIAAE